MMKEKNKFQPVTSSEIFQIYELLQKSNQVAFSAPSHAEAKVEAIVSSINGYYFGKEIYATDQEKAVAYLYFLIKNHPFIDGNKRTAVLTFETVCKVNGLSLRKYIQMDEMAIFIEKIGNEDYQNAIKELALGFFD